MLLKRKKKKKKKAGIKVRNLQCPTGMPLMYRIVHRVVVAKGEVGGGGGEGNWEFGANRGKLLYIDGLNNTALP